MQKRILPGLAIFISGLGVGWLAGLSVSPVISTILSSLLSILVGVISLLVGLKSSNDLSDHLFAKLRRDVNPIPISLLIIGICIGSTFGLYARTNSYFGEDLLHTKQLLIRSGFSSDTAEKITREYALATLLNRVSQSEASVSTMGKKNENERASQPNLAVQEFTDRVAGLFATKESVTNASFCNHIRFKHGKELLEYLKMQNVPKINALLELNNDSLALEKIKNILCP